MAPRFNARRYGALAFGLAATVAATGPCDIYASGGTPCVAAHSSTRALYASYSGPLYQLTRGSDGATTQIMPLSAGSVANAAAQDQFCGGSTCTISVIYDQSGRGNHLTQAPAGGAFAGPLPGGYDNLAAGGGAPVRLNGQKAYGVFIAPLTGYRNDNTNGISTGDTAEGLYAVFDGTHYNSKCCFDYGNAETSNLDTGASHMEAIYFGGGDGSINGKGSGNGPWIMADLENGLFSGYNAQTNLADPAISWRFVTAMVKGEPNQWAIKGADATSGGLNTYYNGIRPAGYTTMNKEGAIILGIGGDNSNNAQGTFYEGVMTSGYPSDATDAAVQANIVAAKYTYDSSLMTGGPGFTVGSHVSMRATTSCCTADYLTETGSTVSLEAVTSSSAAALKKQASWIVHQGLANSACFSFESVNTPGSYIRHSNYQLMVNANDGSKLFGEDATFCPQAGVANANYNSFRSWSYPTRWWRHYDGVAYIAANGGEHNFDSKTSFNDDVTFQVQSGFA